MPPTQALPPREVEKISRHRQLGLHIRNIRTSKELTQGDVAARLQEQYGKVVLQTTISRWELGQVELTADQILDLDDALEVPRGTLLAQSGYIRLSDVQPQTVEQMLAVDPNIADEFRDLVLTVYRQAIKQSRQLWPLKPRGVR